MSLRLLFALLLISVLSLQACFQDPSEDIPSSYTRSQASVSFQDVTLDSIEPLYHCMTRFSVLDDAWDSTLTDCNYYGGIWPGEGTMDCNRFEIPRRGDTVFLRMGLYTPPDDRWQVQYECLDELHPFVLDDEGIGHYVGNGNFTPDPELRVHGDSLFFKRTLLIFYRGITSNSINGEGATTSIVRYPQYGYLQNLDSLQTELIEYCKGYTNCSFPTNYTYYRVAWQEYLYIASDKNDEIH